MPKVKKETRMTRALIGMIKVSAAVLLVATVGYLTVILDHRGEVAPANADILDLFGGPRDSSAQFVRSLDRLGHDTPQTYDLNGNVIHFSVNYLSNEPRDVVSLYQREFRRAGINEGIYTDLSPEKADERHLEALTGGIVPTLITDDKIVMGGMITRGKPKDFIDILRVYSPEMDAQDFFVGHRYIEAFRDPGSNLTTVISSWSDEGFDYGKMFPGRYHARDFSVDQRVPSCPGCVRLNRFADLNAEPSPYESNIFSTTFSEEQISEFYLHAMTARGWELMEEARGLDHVLGLAFEEESHPKNLRFSKEEKVLTILVQAESGDATYVQTMMTRDGREEP